VANIVTAYGNYQNQKTLSNLTASLSGTIKPQNGNGAVPTPDPEVNLIILNDRNCGVCDPTGIVDSLGTILNLKTTTFDYSSAEAKQMISDLEITELPAYLFDSSVLKATNYTLLERFLVLNGDYYVLRTSGNLMIGREKSSTPTIDLFVMSQCPYGTMAEDNLEAVMDKYGDEITLNINFIATATGNNTFDSLHGQPEVDEDLRQVCAIAKYPDKWFDFILCRNKDISSTNWQACAQENGMDVSVIENCVDTEAAQLLTENIKLAEDLQVGSSPTFLINNQLKFSGAMPSDAIEEILCKSDPKPASCS
jgi:predicted DsbA family dithiol-disulfide isomerase